MASANTHWFQTSQSSRTSQAAAALTGTPQQAALGVHVCTHASEAVGGAAGARRAVLEEDVGGTVGGGACAELREVTLPQRSTGLQASADRWRRCSRGPHSPGQSESSAVTTEAVSHQGSGASQVPYLQQAAVTLLALLHVQVPAARPPQQALRQRRVEQTHPAAVQQADGQICGAAAAKLLPRQEPGGDRCGVRPGSGPGQARVRPPPVLTRWTPP